MTLKFVLMALVNLGNITVIIVATYSMISSRRRIKEVDRLILERRSS